MKIDMHVHTSEVSRCGKLTAAQMVSLYREAGYDAICITNHCSASTAKWHAANGRFDFLEHFESSYRLAREEGEKTGLKVFRGYEFRCNYADNDFLIYDIPKYLLDHLTELFALPLKECLRVFKENGVMVFHAHPFRKNTTVADPGLYYGIEVYNGSNGDTYVNEMAQVWANAHPHLVQIAGSDAHSELGVGRAGIITDRDVCTQDDLWELLRSGDFTVIRNHG